jgi:M6 family metalloprotease-like protein
MKPLASLASLLLVVAACDSEPALDLAAASGELNSTPSSKYDIYSLIKYEDFGFQRMWTAGGGKRYTGNPPPAAERPLLVLYLDVACDQPWSFPRTMAEYDALFFTGMRNVRSAFLENSWGRFTFHKAKDSQRVCVSALAEPGPARMRQALAGITHDLGTFDTNADGVLVSNELTVLVVEDEPGFAGQALSLGDDCVDVPGGVSYCGHVARLHKEFDLGTAVHELGHTLGGINLYGKKALNPVGSVMSGTYAGGMSLASKHFDAVHKFQLGWQRPDIVDMAEKPSGTRVIYCAEDPRAELDGSILFWNSQRGKKDFFVLEARCGGGYDDKNSGLGVALWSTLLDENLLVYENETMVVNGPKPTCEQQIGNVFTCQVPSVCLADTNPDSAGNNTCFGSSLLTMRDNGGNGWAPMIHEDRSVAPTRFRVLDRVYEWDKKVGFLVEWSSASGTLPGYPGLGTPLLTVTPVANSKTLKLDWTMSPGLLPLHVDVQRLDASGAWIPVSGAMSGHYRTHSFTNTQAATTYTLRVCADRSEPIADPPYIGHWDATCSNPVTAKTGTPPTPTGPPLPPSCPPGKYLCLNGCQPPHKCMLPQ